jgi:hypothetical protein
MLFQIFEVSIGCAAILHNTSYNYPEIVKRTLVQPFIGSIITCIM